MKSLRLLLIPVLLMAALALAGFSMHGLPVSASVNAAPPAAPTPTVAPAQPNNTNPAQPNGNNPRPNRGNPGGMMPNANFKGCDGPRGPMGMMFDENVPQSMMNDQFMMGSFVSASDVVTKPVRPGNGRNRTQVNLQQCAANAVQNTQKVLDSVKADQAFAKGKMDTSLVDPLVTHADSVYQQATSANSSGNYTATIAYAQAANQTAEAARVLMVNALNTQLPSQQNRPQPKQGTQPNRPQPNAKTLQVQVSRQLEQIYGMTKQAISDANQAGNKAGDLSLYLSTAKALYTQAYNEYQAGKYEDAGKTARAITPLLGAMHSLFRANNVQITPTPVTVPAPNF